MQLVVIGLYPVVYRRDLIKLCLTLVTLLFSLGKLLFAVGDLLFTVSDLLFGDGDLLFLLGDERFGGGIIGLALVELCLGRVIFLLPLIQLRLALVVLLLAGAYLAAAVFVGDDGGGVILGGAFAVRALYLVVVLGYKGYRVADIIVLQVGLAQDIGDIPKTGGRGEKAADRGDHKADADDHQCDSFHLISSFLVKDKRAPRLTYPLYACVQRPQSHPRKWAAH